VSCIRRNYESMLASRKSNNNNFQALQQEKFSDGIYPITRTKLEIYNLLGPKVVTLPS
jgi:hypothetical protein